MMSDIMAHARIIAMICAGFMLSLQGCATPDHPRADDAPGLAPPPLLGLGLAAVTTGAALRLWCDDGAPQTVVPGDVINQEGTVTWLGHSGFVVQMAGQTLITDPVVHETALTRASLSGKMARAPDISSLTTLDAVVISHDDLDHLDRATLRALAERFLQATLVLPEGTRLARPVTGFAHTVRLSEWQAHQLGGLTFTAPPAIHLSRRPPFLSAPGPALSDADQDVDR